LNAGLLIVVIEMLKDKQRWPYVEIAVISLISISKCSADIIESKYFDAMQYVYLSVFIFVFYGIIRILKFIPDKYK
jgi:hypothetical protein